MAKYEQPDPPEPEREGNGENQPVAPVDPNRPVEPGKEPGREPRRNEDNGESGQPAYIGRSDLG